MTFKIKYADLFQLIKMNTGHDLTIDHGRVTRAMSLEQIADMLKDEVFSIAGDADSVGKIQMLRLLHDLTIQADAQHKVQVKVKGRRNKW